MANKRDLKKFIRNTCGNIALDMVIVGEHFSQIDKQDVEKTVFDCAVLQTTSISRMGIIFDRSVADFASKGEYAAARRKYYRSAYKALLVQFDKDVAELVKKMNQALPEEVRQSLKKAVNV